MDGEGLLCRMSTSAAETGKTNSRVAAMERRRYLKT
jgi:hypothetical protein